MLRHRIHGTRVVLISIAEERVQIACSRKADTQHQWVLRSKHQLILEYGIETVLHADLRGIGCAGETRFHAICEGPGTARNGDRWRVWRRPLGQGSLRRIESEGALVRERHIGRGAD